MCTMLDKHVAKMLDAKRPGQYGFSQSKHPAGCWLLPAKEFRIRILVELNTSECGQQNRENHPDEDPR
jgi:hypothetical protein